MGPIEERDSAPAGIDERALSPELTRAAAQPGRPEGTDETGAALFPQLVWAHYQWERRLHGNDGQDAALEQAYRDKLSQFQRKATSRGASRGSRICWPSWRRRSRAAWRITTPT